MIKQRIEFDLGGRRVTHYELGEPDEVRDGTRIHFVSDDVLNLGENARAKLAALGLEPAGRDPALYRTAFAEKAQA